MADDRFHDAFAFWGLSIGLSQWPGASNDLWAPLITGTQEYCSRCSSTIYALNKHWFEFLQKRVAGGFRSTSTHHVMPHARDFWSVYMQFLQKALTDYQKEFVELGRLGIVVGSEPVTLKPKKSTSRVDEFRRTQTIQ